MMLMVKSLATSFRWKNIETSSSGLDILSDGSFIVAGSLSSKSGDFADVDWYGDIFDCFAAKISATGELLWTKAYGAIAMIIVIVS